MRSEMFGFDQKAASGRMGRRLLIMQIFFYQISTPSLSRVMAVFRGIRQPNTVITSSLMAGLRHLAFLVFGPKQLECLNVFMHTNCLKGMQSRLFATARVEDRSMSLLLRALLCRLGYWLLISVAVSALLSSCSDNSRRGRVSPPFMPGSDVVAHEQMYFASELSGMTGDQQVFAIWSLDGSREMIEMLTSDSIVWDKLCWLKPHSEKIDKGLEFFQAYATYRKVQPIVLEMLQDPSARYAYEELRVVNGSITSQAIWICSPKLKKLLFLRAH